MDDLKYMVIWFNAASKELQHTRLANRDGAIRVANRMKESPQIYSEVLVTVRGDNGYFQPLD